METVVGNIGRLSLPDNKRNQLEKLASFHKRYSNIRFNILVVKPDEMIIATTQHDHLSRNYADKRTLITRTKELFKPFFNGKIHVHATIFRNDKIDSINGKWIRAKMKENGIELLRLTAALSVDKTNISAWINENRPMSKPVKAMFYYYFWSLTLEDMFKQDIETEDSGKKKTRTRDIQTPNQK